MNTRRKVVPMPEAQPLIEATTHTFIRAAEHLASSKAAYEEARDALIPLLGRLPSEGTKRIQVGADTVVVKARLNRRMDSTKLKRALELLPASVTARVLPVTHKLSVRELNWLEEHDNDSYQVVRRVFTATKGTPSISVSHDA